MRRAALALATGLGLAGCGVGAQSEPEEVRIPGPASPEAGAPGDAAGTGLRVWFVRGNRLEAAERPVDRPGHRTTGRPVHPRAAPAALSPART